MTNEDVHAMLLEWLAWRAAMKSLRHDAGVMETAGHLKLGVGYGLVLRELSEAAASREKAALAAVRMAGVNVMGAKEDRGETFVWWKHRGHPDMYRIAVEQLQPVAQEKLNELMQK